MSVISTLPQQTTSTSGCIETRNYKLNRSKALEKKLQYTERDDISVEVTGGGWKVLFNTGIYELIKDKIDHYFLESRQYSYNHKPVLDKGGNVVETKYTVTKGKASLYTINMYHTKCSYLVNGRNPRHFISEDLPKIVDSIRSQLDRPISAINDELRQMLINMESVEVREEESNSRQQACISGATEEVSTLVTNQVNIPEMSDMNVSMTIEIEEESEVVTDNSNSQENTEVKRPLNNNNHESAYVTTNNANIQKQLINLNLIMKELKSNQENTQNQLCQIRDELCSLRKHCSTLSKSAEPWLEELSGKSDAIQRESLKNAKSLDSRLNAMSDILKGLKFTMEQVQSIPTVTHSPMATRNPRNRSLNPDCNETETSNHIGNRQTNNENRPTETFTRVARTVTRDRVMLIGDSIFKVINKRGLNEHIDVESLSGAKVHDIQERVKMADFRQYNDVVLYVGGNDVSSGKQRATLKRELQDVVERLLDERHTVYLCTLCPRKDADVQLVNDDIKQICEYTGAILIDCYNAFVYGNGQTVNHYISRDGIHLNRYGARTLVNYLNQAIHIIKKRTEDHNSTTPRQRRSPQQPQTRAYNQTRSNIRCNICGRNNHITQDCRYRHNRWNGNGYQQNKRGPGRLSQQVYDRH